MTFENENRKLMPKRYGTVHYGVKTCSNGDLLKLDDVIAALDSILDNEATALDGVKYFLDHLKIKRKHYETAPWDDLVEAEDDV